MSNQPFDMFGSLAQSTQTQQTPQQVQPKPMPHTQPVQQPVQQMNQNTTVQNLNALMNKRDYSDQEWDQRESLYVTECNKINVNSSNLNTNEIVVAAGRIDALLTPLRIDNVYAQKNAIKYDNQIKIQKELLFNSIKKSATIKLTVDDTKSLITEKIANTQVGPNGENLFTLSEKYNERVIFTKGLIDTLQDKKDLLITYSGMLKIENSVTNFSQNVPTDGQINRMGR